MSENGFCKLKLMAKKTTGRTVTIDEETVNAIVAYQLEINAKDEDEMFEPGDGKDPVNKWVLKLNKFFKKYGLNVKSHDFRVTQATHYYETTKDIMATKDFVGHSSIKTT